MGKGLHERAVEHRILRENPDIDDTSMRLKKAGYAELGRLITLAWESGIAVNDYLGLKFAPRSVRVMMSGAEQELFIAFAFEWTASEDRVA